MNTYERMLYWLFKKSKGIKLGSKYVGTPKTASVDVSPMNAAKASSKWEIAALYYQLPKEDDLAKDILNWFDLTKQ